MQPVTEMDIELARIADAGSVIDPVFLDTPQYFDRQLGDALGRQVLVKVETLNPLRSFKGRGTEMLVRDFAPGTSLVCESTGNFGQAIAYSAGKRGIQAEVFVPAGISAVKLDRMRALAARVHVVDGDPEESARAHAAEHPDRTFVEDGREVAVAEGAGTIGVELLRAGTLDTVVLPVGDGALITGVARWIKEHSPQTRIIGVCASKAAAMVHSWRTGQVRNEQSTTFAEGIAISSPIPESIARMRTLVDDMVVVDDSAMLAAIRTAAFSLGVLPEPAGAASIAAIAEHDFPGEVIATVITGANASPSVLNKALAEHPIV